ncbi:MAG: hypothetical protein QOI26_1133, partial [Pseudonocardiales bacterium]|nr:hypothetical protein [Pseudonocardiales bacterium]
LDTRAGIGAPRVAMKAGQTLVVQVAGRGGVPAAVSAVAVNIAVLSPSRAGSVAVFPQDTGWTGIGSVSFPAGMTVQSMLISSLGSTGRIAIRNNTGVDLQVLADVAGYFVAGTPAVSGAFGALAATRVLDTRSGPQPIAAGQTVTTRVLGAALPESGVSAVAVNIGVLSAPQTGSVAVYPGGSTWNGSASISFRAGVTVQSTLTAALTIDGTLSIRNNTRSSLQLIADVTGYYVAQPAPVAFQPPVQINPPHGKVLSVSCATTSSCIAVTSEGYAIAYDGANWGQQRKVAPSLNDLTSVSCPAVTFCLAVDFFGGAAVYDGTSWSTRPTGIGGRLTSVSCAAVSFCLAVDELGRYLRYDGSSWSAPSTVPGAPALQAVTCASASFCATADGSGKVSTYDGSTWSPLTSLVTSTRSIHPALSCLAPSSCVLVESSGQAFSYDGTAWTELAVAAPFYGVSCASGSFCVATDTVGNAHVFDGQAWAAPVVVVHGYTSGFRPTISCPAVGSCMAVWGGLISYASRYDSSAWAPLTRIDASERALNAVSCTSADFCVAVSSGGEALVYDGVGWTGPVLVDPRRSLLAVSCGTPTLCLALDDLGQVLSYDGQRWFAPVAAGPGKLLRAVSCSGPAFCAAVDSAGEALTFDGTAWSPPVTLNHGAQSFRISCSSPSFCAAVGTAGDLVTFDGSGWAAGPTAPVSTVFSMSCASPTFCLVSGRALDASVAQNAVFDGSAWKPIRSSWFEEFTSVSCPAASMCLGVGRRSVIGYQGGGWALPANAYARAVSCPTPTFCMVVDSGLASRST